MRKWAILLIVVGLIAGGYWYARTYVRYTPEWDQAKFAKVTRGDIRVPITAAGLIEPNQRIEVKSKASGEVIDIRVSEGTFVRTGDVLLVLKKDDEQRSMERSQADRDRLAAVVAQAGIEVKKSALAITNAEAQVTRLVEQGKITLFEREKAIDMSKGEAGASKQELLTTAARHEINEADLKAARASLESARSNAAIAEQVLEQQKSALRVAEKALEDAKERLAETTIVAKQDAIVTDVMIRVGMLVQSGTSGFTGGTPCVTLADVSKKKVVARVDEADYGRVLNISPLTALPEMPKLRELAEADAQAIATRAGQVKLSVDAFPNENFSGVIERVEPQGKLNAGSSVIQFDVHVVIDDSKIGMLPLGAQAQVEFTVESAVGVLRVPSEAVKSFQDERGVWVKTPKDPGSIDPFGKRFQACRFGITDGEYTELIAVVGNPELNEGQEVFTRLPKDREKDEG